MLNDSKKRKCENIIKNIVKEIYICEVIISKKYFVDIIFHIFKTRNILKINNEMAKDTVFWLMSL